MKFILEQWLHGKWVTVARCFTERQAHGLGLSMGIRFRVVSS
ncbi:MAG: hypothetical protein OXG44_15145 [Gammaproteobacteria bacterium]|nr:hypothetical protein [Gammaproteobacteria bacterium]